jgi:periplasmic divalent cation tolerance protein
MIEPEDTRVVLVTAPDAETARRIARQVLESRLVACVNLVPGIESHYWWQGRLESGQEVLMVMKTTAGRIPELKDAVIAAHPYDTAAFVVLPIESGSGRYLDWIRSSVA